MAAPPLRRFLPLARSLNALFGVALVLLEPWLNRRRVHSTSPVREAVAWLGCPGACSGVATRRASVHYGVRPSAFLTSSTLVVRPPLLHEEWRPGLFALSATVLVETYARFRGPWTEQHEQDYRTLRARFAGAPPPRRPPRTTPITPATTNSVWRASASTSSAGNPTPLRVTRFRSSA